MNMQKPFLLVCLMLHAATLAANTGQQINTEQNEFNLNYAYGTSVFLIAAGIALGLNSNKIAQIIKKKSAAYKIKIAAAGLTALGTAATFGTMAYHRKSLAKKRNTPKTPDKAKISTDRPNNQSAQSLYTSSTTPSSLATNSTGRPFIPGPPTLLETPPPNPVRADSGLTPPTPPKSTSSPNENGGRIPLSTPTLRSNTCLAIMLRAVKAATIKDGKARLEINEALKLLTNGVSSKNMSSLLKGNGAIKIGFGAWLASSQCKWLISKMSRITKKNELGVEFIYNPNEAALIKSINTSCHRRTSGLLPQAITSFDRDDKLTLLCVLSFKAPWLYKFTQPAQKTIFTNGNDSTETILLMRQRNNYFYYENDKDKFLYVTYNPDGTLETEDNDDQYQTTRDVEIRAARLDIERNLTRIETLRQSIAKPEIKADIKKLQADLHKEEVLLQRAQSELTSLMNPGKATVPLSTNDKIDQDREYGIMFVLKSDASTEIDHNKALETLLTKGATEDVDFGLPKGKIELPETDIVDLIKSLGPKAIFTEGGLSNLDAEIFVNKVIAKGYVAFDSNGTEAVMQTSMSFTYRGASSFEPAPKQFILDKPFEFSIVGRNKKDNIAISLFSGKVTNANQIKPID